MKNLRAMFAQIFYKKKNMSKSYTLTFKRNNI